MKIHRPALVPALAILLLLSFPLGVRAQSAAPAASAPADPEAWPDVATVRLDGRTLLRVCGLPTHPASERARIIADRIAQAAGDPTISADSLSFIETENGTQMMAEDRLLLVITGPDARIERLSPAELAPVIRLRLRQAIELYRADRAPKRLLVASAWTLAATLALVAALLGLNWLLRRSREATTRFMRKRISGVKIQSLELVRASDMEGFADGAVRFLGIVAVLALVFFYLDIALGLFPWTRAFAADTLGYALAPLHSMGAAFAAYLPSLVFLAVLGIVTKVVLTTLRLLTSSLDRGLIDFPGFDRDWAWPSYGLVRFVIVAFAVVIAFPYLPGSNSPAFQGVSLFVGVLLSIGSSSLMGNLMAGYTLIYGRALHVGDVVKIGDLVGRVAQTALLVTHVRTPKNELVIIPNSTIMSGQVMNYSSLAKDAGLILHATVGIGYETPWRQVEAMLLEAARRTPGVLAEPRPYVLHRQLGDFAVTYEINAYTSEPQNMLATYDVLYRNILDQFNEYGVQIMTPAYEGDPDVAKVVAKENWHLAPAAPPEGEAPGTASPPMS